MYQNSLSMSSFWDFDFGTTFGTPFNAQTLGFWRGLKRVPKTVVFGTSPRTVEIDIAPLRGISGLYSKGMSSTKNESTIGSNPNAPIIGR
jgi:hypothetical protein